MPESRLKVPSASILPPQFTLRQILIHGAMDKGRNKLWPAKCFMMWMVEAEENIHILGGLHSDPNHWPLLLFMKGLLVSPQLSKLSQLCCGDVFQEIKPILTSEPSSPDVGACACWFSPSYLWVEILLLSLSFSRELQTLLFCAAFPTSCPAYTRHLSPNFYAGGSP